MCLTVPGKIKSIKKGMAVVENGARRAHIDMSLVFDAKVGDWVLYATDRAVRRISEDDAKEIISLLEDHYHPVDVSKLPLKFKKIIFKVRAQETRDKRQDADKYQISNNKFQINSKSRIQKDQITKSDIEYLLSLKGKDNLETLFAEANSIRKEKIEDFVCIHGIIEFSNYCKNNCLYCGIRHNQPAYRHLRGGDTGVNRRGVVRYRMSPVEIFNAAKEAVEKEGYKLIVLQSGEDDYYSDDDLVEIIKKIKSEVRAFIFISVGERSADFYKKAWRAGASGSLIRFETSNHKLYAKLRPGHSLDDRIQLIKYQQELGYYVASGSMVGLPGQTISDIADDLLMIKELDIPMISAGPFIPASGTPLEKSKILISKSETNSKLKTQDYKQAQIEYFLKYTAIARFMMPEIKIPVTTALETLDPKNGRHRGLLAGANALMFNLTPEKCAGNYSIYDNKYREREKVWQKYGLFKGEESYEMLEKRLKVLL